MRSNYLPNVTVPEYDTAITEALQKIDFDGGGTTMVIAVENRDGQVYRLIKVEGMSNYLDTVHAITVLGFKDLIGPYSPTSKEGYDNRFQPSAI